MFGVSQDTDAYFISLAITSYIQLLLLLPVEQFLYFFLAKRQESRHKAELYYLKILFLAALFSFGVTLLFALFLNLIITLFISENLISTSLCYQYVMVLLVGMLFLPLNNVMDKFFNANERFAIPYILESLPTFFISICYVNFWLGEAGDLSSIVIVQSAGIVIGFLLRFELSRRLLSVRVIHSIFKFRWRDFLEVKPLLKNSFGVGLSNIIYQTYNPVITNLLTGMPAGTPSAYYYAQRAIQIVYSIVVGPSLKVFQTNFSNLWTSKEIKKAKSILYRYIWQNFLIMVVCCLLAYFLIPYFIILVAKDSVNHESIVLIQRIFSILGLWFLILTVEHAVGVIAANSKTTIIFLKNNIIFIMLFLVISSFMKQFIGVYSIGISAAIAQIVSLSLYSLFSFRLYKNLEV